MHRIDREEKAATVKDKETERGYRTRTAAYSLANGF